MKLSLIQGSAPEPMSAQDLQDWGGKVDEKAMAGWSLGPADENVLSAGQAVLDVTNARRGRP